MSRAPGHAGATAGIGGALFAQARFGERVEALRAGIEKHPDNFGMKLNLARAGTAHDLPGAAKAARQTLELDPSSAATQAVLAWIDFREGRLTEARAGIEAALQGTMADIDRAGALFELGLILDDLNEAAAAFEAFTEGNKLQRRKLMPANVDAARFRERAAANAAWIVQRPEAAATGAESAQDGTGPVFFVGFPRSGTTLMEQGFARPSEGCDDRGEIATLACHRGLALRARLPGEARRVFAAYAGRPQGPVSAPMRAPCLARWRGAC